MASVQFSRSVMSIFLWPHGLKHAKLPCPAPTPGTGSNSCPLSLWYYEPCYPLSPPSPPAINLSQYQGLFQGSQYFTSGAQSIGVSASASVLPMNIQDWFPLGWTGWISLQSKGRSRVLSNTTVQKHQFCGTQLSSQSRMLSFKPTFSLTYLKICIKLKCMITVSKRYTRYK